MKWQIDIEINEQTSSVARMTNILKILADQLVKQFPGDDASDFLTDDMNIVNGHPSWVISEAGPEAHQGTAVMRMMLTSATFESKTFRPASDMKHVEANISTGETRKVDTPKRH